MRRWGAAQSRWQVPSQSGVLESEPVGVDRCIRFKLDQRLPRWYGDRRRQPKASPLGHEARLAAAAADLKHA